MNVKLESLGYRLGEQLTSNSVDDKGKDIKNHKASVCRSKHAPILIDFASPMTSKCHSNLTTQRPHIDSKDLDVVEYVCIGDLLCASIFFIGPDRRGTAVGVAEPEVIEVDDVGAWGAAAEDDAMLAERAGGVGAESNDAMLPSVRGIVWAGAIGLFAVMLVDADTFFGLVSNICGLTLVRVVSQVDDTTRLGSFQTL